MRYFNLFILATLAVLITACFGGSTYYLSTDDARGIEAGDKVYRQGISIGEVEDVSFDGDKVKIEISVEEPLYENQGFDIRTGADGLQLELDRPDQDANALAGGATINDRNFGEGFLQGLEGLGRGLEGIGEALERTFTTEGRNLEESLERIANRWEDAGEEFAEAAEEWAEEHEEDFEELERKLERWENRNEADFEAFGEEVEAWAENFEGDIEDFVETMEKVSEDHEVGSRAWKREMRRAFKKLQ